MTNIAPQNKHQNKLSSTSLVSSSSVANNKLKYNSQTINRIKNKPMQQPLLLHFLSCFHIHVSASIPISISNSIFWLDSITNDSSSSVIFSFFSVSLLLFFWNFWSLFCCFKCIYFNCYGEQEPWCPSSIGVSYNRRSFRTKFWNHYLYKYLKYTNQKSSCQKGYTEFWGETTGKNLLESVLFKNLTIGIND